MNRCRTHSINLLAYLASPLWLTTVLGYSTDPVSLTRNVNKTVSLTNSPIVVTVTFSNATLNPLRGFYFADQIPSNLVVETYSVTLNGKGITNYLFESGVNGDIYPGCTPCRWILELPPDFSETNRIPAYGNVKMIYSLNSPVAGTFNLSEYSWAGYQAYNYSNVSFGYSETAEQKTVSFITTATPPILAGRQSTNVFVLQLIGVPGYSYALEASTNLLNWTSLKTNIAPFEYTETNTSPALRRFFRARQIH